MSVHSITRRLLLGGAAAAVARIIPALAQNANDWPSHPVKIIVPYPAGGSTDVLFRLLADRLKEKLGQSFVVENRSGASGNVGIDAVAKSAPDGYTIGGATVGHFSINQFLFAKMPFDAEKDLVAPSLAYELPNVAVVAAAHVQAKTLQEFIAWAKARPNGISIGSPGPGTTPHLSGVLFAARTGVPAVQVPFRGAAQTIPAMLAGDVTFAVDNLASYISHIESGQIRALAVTSAKRWPTLPDVPTMAEAGVDDFVVTSWGAYVLPAETPTLIVEKLAAAHKEIAVDEAMQKKFLAAGGRVLHSTPAETKAFAAKETRMWRELVRLSGLTPQ
ncbi:MAG: tripartite tricarboxylate transporter substrate binding protein [Proteobacteria bacterium]|nr:MAG: tripartite tricarboxylate transporter substrate binding protein [Pseudomonadota bacterium]